MDDGLFADPRPGQPTLPTPNPEALPEWQVASMRKALDELGLVAMVERQAVIEELVGRQLASLRDLTFTEARGVSEALAARKKPSATAGSAWDNRDEATWIDRL